MNAVLAIHPYKANGMWVFDDPQWGLGENHSSQAPMR